MMNPNNATLKNAVMANCDASCECGACSCGCRKSPCPCPCGCLKRRARKSRPTFYW
jgi:hypothetical protein